jgi:hypothetical protein
MQNKTKGKKKETKMAIRIILPTLPKLIGVKST